MALHRVPECRLLPAVLTPGERIIRSLFLFDIYVNL